MFFINFYCSAMMKNLNISLALLENKKLKRTVYTCIVIILLTNIRIGILEQKIFSFVYYSGARKKMYRFLKLKFDN